jgi:hypothetical protein
VQPIVHAEIDKDHNEIMKTKRNKELEWMGETAQRIASGRPLTQRISRISRMARWKKITIAKITFSIIPNVRTE